MNSCARQDGVSGGVNNYMVEINNLTKKSFSPAKIRRLVEQFLIVYKKTGYDVSIALVSSAVMRRLNRDYRGKDKTTDVLSFSANQNLGKVKAKKYLGEVVINVDEVVKANKYLDVFGLRKSAPYIFYFLLVHGLLHLVGFTDDKEKDRLKMLNLGESFLEQYG